jgi:hypothetical protein
MCDCFPGEGKVGVKFAVRGYDVKVARIDPSLPLRSFAAAPLPWGGNLKFVNLYNLSSLKYPK